MTMLPRYCVLFAATLLLALPALSPVLCATASGQEYFPPQTGPWSQVTPRETGANAQLLRQAMQLAGEKDSKGVVVLHGGKILAERYWDGWTQDTAGPLNSATKSIAATLVGMAIESGHIQSLDQSCSDFLSEWQYRPRYRRIEIQHLLSMTSGLKNSKGIFVAGFLARDERRFATRLPISHAPGTHWSYHNSAYHLLFPVLEEATGIRLDEYTEQMLSEPLGMEHANWRTRFHNDEQFNLMEMSARDAARFGLLILREGQWQGEQLISSGWIADATQPFDENVNPSYGRLWWLNGGAHFYFPLIEEAQRGPIFEGVPEDAFAALGKDDQKIYIVPSLDLVVTRLGDPAGDSDYALSEFDSEFLGLICWSLQVGN